MAWNHTAVSAISTGRPFIQRAAQIIGCFAMLSGLMACATVSAEPIAVRFSEGATHGFLVLRSESGESLAQGELIQNIKGDRVDSRLVFRFKDGSLHDEKVSFSQERVFTMQTYQLIQRGPSFPDAVQISMDRKTGAYEIRSRTGADGPEETANGRLDLPPDVYNGMTVTLLRNLPEGKNETVQFVTFTPEPKLINLMLLRLGEETVRVGDLSKQATRYSLNPQLGAITRLFGRLLGKLPDDFHYHFWLLNEDVPAFVSFEGPLYLKGPNWRIELLSPRLVPKGEDKKQK